MKDIDLNIFPVYYQNKSTYDALLSLICNNYVSSKALNEDNFFDIEYDSSNQVLKLTLHDWSIDAQCLVQQETSNLTYPLTLLEATVILTSQGKNLKFSSKFGTFIPYIKQKEGISITMPCAYLHCDLLTRNKDYANVKDLFNEASNDLIGTTITIAPISFDLVAKIQNHLSCYRNWKDIIKSTNGYLLISNENECNMVYLDGINFSDAIAKQEIPLMYSYDINDELIDFNEAGSDWSRAYINQIIYLVLVGLDEEDKKKIYPTLLNNDHAMEWTFSDVQVLILQYLNKLTPNQYVIYADDDHPFSDYIQLVTDAKKTLVKVTKDAYHELIDSDVNSIYVCAQNIIKENYYNAFINADISFSEQNNLNILCEFIDYLATNYAPLKEQLTNDQISHLSWGIVLSYPDNGGAYSWRLGGGIIAKSNLDNLATLFNVACEIVFRYLPNINYKDFRDAWLKNTINFLSTYKVKKHDWNHANDEDQLKNHNKKLS